MPKTKGKRKNFRLKKAIYEILYEETKGANWDIGLTTKQIYARVMESNAKKWLNGSSQLGQILLRMSGVTSVNQTVYSSTNSYNGAVWRLQYPEEYLEWLEE